MGKLKQLHIDCTNECCLVGQPETCMVYDFKDQSIDIIAQTISITEVTEPVNINVQVF